MPVFLDPQMKSLSTVLALVWHFMCVGMVVLLEFIGIWIAVITKAALVLFFLIFVSHDVFFEVPAVTEAFLTTRPPSWISFSRCMHTSVVVQHGLKWEVLITMLTWAVLLAFVVVHVFITTRQHLKCFATDFALLLLKIMFVMFIYRWYTCLLNSAHWEVYILLNFVILIPHVLVLNSLLCFLLRYSSGS